MTQPGPCIICGAKDYALSMGGPDICPSCDCGNFGPEVVKAQAQQITVLNAELELQRRLARVDASLARRLGESIQANTRLRNEIEKWLQAYPLTQFPEPDFAKAAELLTAGGLTLDAISASNMRHVLHRVLKFMNDQHEATDQRDPPNP
jgi:hypothetical protein